MISTPQLASSPATNTKAILTIFDLYALERPVAYLERVDEEEG